MPAGTSSRWTTELEFKLLLLVIQTSAIATPKWDEIARLMGGTNSADSLRQHFQKIKRTNPIDFDAAPQTPRSKPTPNKSKRKSVLGMNDSLNDDDDEESASPCVKRAKKLQSEDPKRNERPVFTVKKEEEEDDKSHQAFVSLVNDEDSSAEELA